MLTPELQQQLTALEARGEWTNSMEKHQLTTRAATHRRSATGAFAFTLVELTLVVAITAVLAAIAVPRFSDSTARYKLETATRRLASDIEFAQQEAIASSSSRTLTFNYFTKSYTITRLDENGNKVIVSTVSLNTAPYEITSLAASIAGNTATPIKFDGFGKPNGAGTIQLRSGTSRKIISMDGLTGRTVVK